MTLSDEEPGDARLYLDSSWSRRSNLHRVTVLGEDYHQSLRSISLVISRDTWSTKVNNCAGTDLTLEIRTAELDTNRHPCARGPYPARLTQA